MRCLALANTTLDLVYLQGAQPSALRALGHTAVVSSASRRTLVHEVAFLCYEHRFLRVGLVQHQLSLERVLSFSGFVCVANRVESAVPFGARIVMFRQRDANCPN